MGFGDLGESHGEARLKMNLAEYLEKVGEHCNEGVHESKYRGRET